MTDADNVIEKPKRFRSPPYPMFDLGKAVERASEALKKAHHHPVGVPVLSDSWGMKSSGGKVWRTAAALIQYALMTDTGSGKSRKFLISDITRRLAQDSNPASQKRKEALKTAALSPMIHKELWENFQAAKGLSDTVLKTHLTLDRVENGLAPYSDSAADEVIETYRATLAYAGISDSDTVVPDDGDKDAVQTQTHVHSHTAKAKVGDYVQWTSGGSDQFRMPRCVTWVSDDGSHARVHGSLTGIKMSELTVADRPAPPAAGPAGKAEDPTPDSNDDANDINVLLAGKRLQITADVDAAGIKRLKLMLTKYEEILKLLSQPIENFKRPETDTNSDEADKPAE